MPEKDSGMNKEKTDKDTGINKENKRHGHKQGHAHKNTGKKKIDKNAGINKERPTKTAIIRQT